MEERGPLHLKYRPETFDQFFGNESMIESLQAVLNRELVDIPKTILFYGPSGCGKTTLARIVAKSLGAITKYSISTYNISNMRGIDAAREIIQDAQYMPSTGNIKVYILDEVHKATNEFQNAMLQILEEPPKSTAFILCTTDPDKLLKTIRTRCSSYQVRSLATPKLSNLLKQICGFEGIEFPKEAYLKIAKLAQGSPRQALVILDKVIDIKNEQELIAAINNIMVHEAEAIDICRILVGTDTNKWKAVSKILKNLNDEPERVRHLILKYLGSTLLNRGDMKTAEMMELFMDSFIYKGKAGLIHSCYFACHL